MSEQEGISPLSVSQREMLEEATAAYEAAMTADVDAYLILRGIDPKTRIGARLGVVADPMPGHGWYRGMLAIPYLGHDGRVLQIRFRCLEKHDHQGHGKYNTVKHDPARMFNVPAIHQARNEIHIAEGELDALVLNQIGLPAVGIPGANSWKRHHRRMLAGFSRIFVWGDPDDAGSEMVNKVSRSLRQAKAIRLKDGDVSETYLSRGKDFLLGLAGAA